MSVPGLFTHGSPNRRLPHPPIPTRMLLAAHAAFIEAFTMLRAAPPAGFVLATALEKEITRQLKDILANELLPRGTVPGFNKTYFSYVIRDAELTSYDGTHPDKKPDIVLGVQRPDGARVIADQDGILVECKPVDATHSLTSEYGVAGIRRFVEGEYGWAMNSAIMVAYVRGRYTIAQHLRANLKKNIQGSPLRQSDSSSKDPRQRQRSETRGPTFYEAPTRFPMARYRQIRNSDHARPLLARLLVKRALLPPDKPGGWLVTNRGGARSRVSPAKSAWRR